MGKTLEKAYEPSKYENDIYKRWEDSGFFNPDVCIEKGVTNSKAPHFSIVLPPPNVTGTLHMGHAAMLAIEDVMVRYHRMKGDRTLWVPGTDHAAIATQSKVEKMVLESEGKTRHDLGREELLKRIDKFAKESHDTIVNQCKKMGASLDWSREAFTLDKERNLAVRTVFKKMYDDGLIYRKFRAVNWSTKGQSTLSDDEIVYVERSAKLYTFKYSEDFPFTIATTRPETKLGDTAVAVNPKDKRYKKFIGKTLPVEFLGQKLELKVIGDEAVDMDFGTGALGVTPAHSMVDYEMSVKHDLELIKVIGEHGKITGEGGKFAGLTVMDAREKVVVELKEQGLLEAEEDVAQNVGTSDRYGDVVEVLPKLQWFIDVNKKVKVKSKIKSLNGNLSLKERMQAVIKDKLIDIIPDRFEKTYFHWIDNLRDWCISRQIWYGHRVPVWYRSTPFDKTQDRSLTADKGEEIYVGVEAPEGEGWEQDSDTLDTWFSSGLWTFSTLGYPDLESDDFKNYHPTSVMETGYDILFFWVARMILMTTYTLGDIPFEKIYLHGLVRDENGKKMSKSLGNVIDPLDMIAKYGTDATRLSLLLGNTPGNDMKLSEDKIAGFRNFTNKLWNISRFMLMNIDEPKVDCKKPEPKTFADHWVLHKLNELKNNFEYSVNNFDFSVTGELLRGFTWEDLADWYLEFVKQEDEKSEVLNYILNTILKLWHPFMPFVTETIWKEVYGEENVLMVEKFSEIEKFLYSETEIYLFNKFCDTVTGIRKLKQDYKIVKAEQVTIELKGGAENIRDFGIHIEKLAGVKKVNFVERFKNESNYPYFYMEGVGAVYLHIEIDVGKERERIMNEIDKVGPYSVGLRIKMSKHEYIKNVPEAVKEKDTIRLKNAEEKLEKLQQQLQQLTKNN